MPAVRRLSLALCALLPATTVRAQDLVIPEARYPSLPATAPSAEGFVPPGWRLERRAEGDLNGDRLADLALVLRAHDPANLIANDGLGEAQLDTNPRILAVAFALPGDAGYRLAVANHRLIPRRMDPVQQDPFDSEDGDMRVERGALRIRLYRFMSAGGSDAGPTTFTFRWQDGAMRLIGYDMFNVQRMSGETSNLSINYLTHRARTATGRIESDAERVRWSRMPARPLLTIDEVGDGLEFDPEGAVSRLP